MTTPALSAATTAKCELVSILGLPLKGWVPDMYCERAPYRPPLDPKCRPNGWPHCYWTRRTR